jgi:ribonuclease P protein component
VKKSENKNPRFCIVVPKKLDKRTVKRNQTKRSLYKFISLNIKKFESNIDVLIIVKKIIQKIDEGKLVEDLKKFIYEYKSFKNN